MEGAMSTVSQNAMTDRPCRSRWNQVQRSFAEWRHFARSRNELMNLSDRALQDIGVCPRSTHLAASKPFWLV
jgi:uncharacterized protein YjiS (DUF1127 family)